MNTTTSNIVEEDEDVFVCDDCGETVEDLDELFEFEVSGFCSVSLEEAKQRLLDHATARRTSWERYRERFADLPAELAQYEWLRVVAETIERVVESNDVHAIFLEARANVNIIEPITRTVRVCSEHAYTCELCDDTYIVPTRSIFGNRRTWNVSGFDETFSNDWSHNDRVCQSCEADSGDCYECGELFRRDDLLYLEYEDREYCESCYENYTHECRYCNERVSESHDSDYCRSESGGDVILNYSYRPEPIFYEVDRVTYDTPYDNNTPFMGFELEVEVPGDRYDSAQAVQDVVGERAYIKSDGSLNYGYEIVTHPHTLEAYKHKSFDWSFLDYLSSHDASSWRTSTCGLHVHISRRAFRSLIHQAMFTYLIQNNASQMQRLAGRSSSNWAKFGEGDAPVSKKVKYGQAWDRYQAVNMTNRNTVEVRIFRGSLMKRRVLMALELVNACFEYTRPMASNDYIKGNLSWNAFAKWCKGRAEYENLNYYIRLYGLYDNHTTATTN